MVNMLQVLSLLQRRTQGNGCSSKDVLCGRVYLNRFGVLLAAFVAMAGHRHVSEGMDGLHCSSSTLLDVVLSGKEESSAGSDDSFVGILDLLRQLDGILDNLADDSKFMTDLRQILTDTEPLERSVKMLTGTLTLLDETLAHPDNIRPKSASGEDLDHICHFCQSVAGSVAPLSKEIEESTAKALEEARNQVKTQLTGSKLVELRKDIDEAIDPLISSKDSLRDSIGAFVDGDVANTIDGVIELIGLVVLALFGIAIPILCCDGSAVCCAAFKSRTPEDSYSKRPSHCACCGWCFGWPLAFIGLFLGGLLMIIIYPISGVCLIMMDVNRENLNDWGPALGLADDPKAFQDTVNVVDECLGEDGQGKLMEVIMVDHKNDNGETTRISLRQKLEDETRGNINEKFDVIIEKTKVKKNPMDESQAFKDLLKFLETDVSQLTTYDPDRIENMKSKPEFAGFALEAELSTTAFASSASCLEFTIDKSGVLKDVELDGTIPGLKTLQNKAKAKGLTAVGQSCDSSFTGGQKPVRDALNSVMKVKQDLRKSNRYKCNLFQGPNGETCDPKDLKKTMKDCVQKGDNDELFMKTKEVSCSYPEFIQYVKNFKERVDVATEELQVQSSEGLGAIADNLKALVNKQMLDQMFAVVDNVNCRFIGDAYWSMVDGLCHQAARGIVSMSTAFAVMGGLVLGLVILMYITFRRVVDNVEISTKIQPEPNAAVVPQ
jgi:hypothetical protein